MSANLLECQDFAAQISDGTLAEIGNELVTVNTVVCNSDGWCIIHYSPEDHPTWKMATCKEATELVTTFVLITW